MTIQRAKPKWNTATNNRKAFKRAKRTASPHEAIYQSHRWRAESKAFREGKQCAMFGTREGCQREAHITDHIRNPAIHHGVDFWDQSNWQPLCRSCSAAKSNTERAAAKKKEAEQRMNCVRIGEKYKMTRGRGTFDFKRHTA